MIKFSKDEINEMLKSGERMNIKEREMYHAEFIEGKFNVVFGSYGKEDKTDNETKEIKGIAACKGIAKGTAKIIIDMKDIKKVHKGDIIVAPYTNPNMLPAMEKAAGIVTEIGGMTSHAAIVSRELKKPCIIGAKNAAKVFKDGDLIELDANSGTARKLS
jgi:pyruvate,water dikinase